MASQEDRLKVISDYMEKRKNNNPGEELVKFFTSNGVLVTPDKGTYNGRDALLKYYSDTPTPMCFMKVSGPIKGTYTYTLEFRVGATEAFAVTIKKITANFEFEGNTSLFKKITLV